MTMSQPAGLPSANPNFPADLAWGFYALAPMHEDAPARLAIGLYTHDLGAEMEFCLQWSQDASRAPSPEAILFGDAMELMDPRAPLFACLARLAEDNPRFSREDAVAALRLIDLYDFTRRPDLEADEERFARARERALVEAELRQLRLAASPASRSSSPPRI